MFVFSNELESILWKNLILDDFPIQNLKSIKTIIFIDGDI